MSQWWHPGGIEHCGGEFNSGTGTSAVTTSPVHNGSYAARMAITDTTSDTQGVRLFRWCEAQQQQALYYSAWYYIPQQVSLNVDSWWHIMQWKSLGSFNAKFALGVANRVDGRMFLVLSRGVDSGAYTWEQTIKNIPVGEWFHLEAYYVKAEDATGQITVWQDGTEIFDLRNVQTANSSDLSWAVINYGAELAPADVTVFVDDAAIGLGRVGSHSAARPEVLDH